MKKIIFTIVLVILYSCSSTHFVDSWRNNEVATFKPNKLLIIGITDNLTARKIFEERLKNEFVKRDIKAFESTKVFNGVFSDSKKSEAEIDAMKEELISDGYDAVIVTAVIGVVNKRQYRSGYYTFGPNLWYRFGPYYYRYQDIYFTPEYYEDYQVYNVETSIYNLKKEEGKSLVWVGAFKIVDPSSITETVGDYVQKIVEKLEEERLITKLY